jgi:antitoxin component of MazEF toxin-antitoxin module
MNPTPLSENGRWIVTCQDTDDGTGDLIIPLPDDLLAAIGLTGGDKLNMEVHSDGTITLTPVRYQHDVETLLGVLADLYHVCGMLDAKVEVLDQIMAALNGEPLPHESLGPYAALDPDGGCPVDDTD